jgi:hypothetical protein
MKLFKGKSKVPKKKHDFWFSPKGVFQNFKAIRWQKMKSQKDGTDGVLKKYFKVVGFIVLLALMFVGIDGLVSLIMTNAGFFG